MRLLAEVEVGRHRVLEEVDQEVAPEHEHGRRGRQPGALGDHLQDDGGQHEARAERDGVAQQPLVPAAQRDDEAAQQVGARREPHAEETEPQVAVAHRPAFPPMTSHAARMRRPLLRHSSRHG
jgi:hypothetical protein